MSPLGMSKSWIYMKVWGNLAHSIRWTMYLKHWEKNSTNAIYLWYTRAMIPKIFGTSLCKISVPSLTKNSAPSLTKTYIQRRHPSSRPRTKRSTKNGKSFLLVTLATLSLRRRLVVRSLHRWPTTRWRNTFSSSRSSAFYYASSGGSYSLCEEYVICLERQGRWTQKASELSLLPIVNYAVHYLHIFNNFHHTVHERCVDVEEVMYTDFEVTHTVTYMTTNLFHLFTDHSKKKTSILRWRWTKIVSNASWKSYLKCTYLSFLYICKKRKWMVWCRQRHRDCAS